MVDLYRTSKVGAVSLLDRMPLFIATCTNDRLVFVRPRQPGQRAAGARGCGVTPLSATPVSVKGSCLCGAVRYEATGTPAAFDLDHCSRCRKASGSAFKELISGKRNFTGSADDRWSRPTRHRYSRRPRLSTHAVQRAGAHGGRRHDQHPRRDLGR